MMKINPIAREIDVTTYLNHSLRLKIICLDPKFSNWLYINFINLEIIPQVTEKSTFTRLDFTKPSYLDIMEEKIIHKHEINLIVDFLKNQLENEYYIQAALNERFLPMKDSYHIRDFYHPSLIYGFDNDRKVFMATGHSEFNIFREFEITYDDLERALHDVLLYYDIYNVDKRITLYCMSNIEPIKFDMNNFIEQLESYFHPDYKLLSDFLHLTIDEKNRKYIHFGINVYDVILHSLENEDGLYSDYRVFSLLYEHKLRMKKNLYFLRNYFNEPSLELFSNEYENILDLSAKLKGYYMKSALIESEFKSALNSVKDMNSIQKIRKYIIEMKNIEYVFLKKFIPYIRKFKETNYEYKCVHNNQTYLNLNKYYNKKIMTPKFNDNDYQDDTEWTRLYTPDLQDKKILNTELSTFILPKIDANNADYIFCEEQIITLPDGVFNTLSILGIGHGFKEPQIATIVYYSGETYQISINLPPATSLPTDKCTCVWSGMFVERLNRIIKLNHFHRAHIHAKSLFIPEGRLKHLILPKYGAYIFSITLDMRYQM